MKIAYLIDKEAIGGGGEYIRRKIAALGEGDEGRAFYADKGECTWKALREWGAERVVVNHLRAAVQLFNPLKWENRSNLFSHLRAREGTRGTIVFVVHGIHLRKYDWMPRTIVNRVKRELRRRLESWIYHRCDRIVALTETDRKDILKLYGEDLNVVVEPNTLEGWEMAREARAVPSTAVALDREAAEGEFKYICIGRFDFQKGQDRWIRYIAREGTRGTPHIAREGTRGTPQRTLFVGDGPMLGKCKRLAKELGIEELFEFAGAIPDADRFLRDTECRGRLDREAAEGSRRTEYRGRLDREFIVVAPSRWEGMPYLMMKARALGCRVLATDCPGNRDVLAGYERWKRLEL